MELPRSMIYYNDSIDPRKGLYAKKIKEISLNEFDIDFFK